MEQQHTSEPWSAPFLWVMDKNKMAIAQTSEHYDQGTREANAQRIVQCVNACAGIKNPEAFSEVAPLLRTLDKQIVAASGELSGQLNPAAARELRKTLFEALAKLEGR